MKVNLTYQDVFVISSALSDLFTEKMGGKTAALLFKFSRQFKDFVEDYNKGIELIKNENEADYKVQITLFNNSPYIEVDKIELSELEELNLTPLTLVKLEKVLIF